MSQQGEASVVLEMDGGERELRSSRLLTIGRDPANDLVLEGEGVSRHHALIRPQGSTCVLVDLGSSNGTFVNGQPMGGATTLAPGDEIGIGEKLLRFIRGEGPGPDAPLASAIDADDGRRTVRSFLRHEVCVLVSDIRGFTRISEVVSGKRLPQIVATWFRIVGDLVHKHGGTIEKFQGDSVLAFWTWSPGADVASTITRVLDAAGEIVNHSASYNAEIADDLGTTRFRVGCGVHRGMAFQGNIGSDSRRDITILGDCVNVTFRIESLCAALDRPILVSSQVRDAAGDPFRFETLGRHELKGKGEPREIFALVTD